MLSIVFKVMDKLKFTFCYFYSNTFQSLRTDVVSVWLLELSCLLHLGIHWDAGHFKWSK